MIQCEGCGEYEAIFGTLNCSLYKIWYMKEPDCVIKIVANCGVLEEDDDCRMM